MLTPEQRNELAPLVGEVVLSFATLEASALRLATAAFADLRSPMPLKRLQFTELLGALAGQLQALGEAAAMARIRRSLGRLKSISDDRNEVVHGQWFWGYSDHSLRVRKTNQSGAGATYKQWTPVSLARLAKEIKAADATVCGVARMYERRTRSSMRARKLERAN
jgi:hypothetical protein